MGYTHYWDRPIKFNEKDFEKFTGMCHKIIETCKPTSPVGGVYYKGEEVKIVGVNSKKDSKPDISGAHVKFNGEGDLGHEAFIIENNPDLVDAFGFCKTNRKPYDIVVVACLIAFKRVFGPNVNISSDGEFDNWKDGIEFFNACFPDDIAYEGDVHSWINK